MSLTAWKHTEKNRHRDRKKYSDITLTAHGVTEQQAVGSVKSPTV